MENNNIPIHIRVPNKLLLDKELSNSAIFTYFILSLYKNNQTHQAFPGQETLAKKGSKSQQYFSKGVKELCEKKYIIATANYKKAGIHCSNTYTFTDKCEKAYTIILKDIIDELILFPELLAFYGKIKRFIYNETLQMNYTTKTQIAELTGLNVKTVRKLLVNLEKTKLISVVENEGDKRCIDVVLQYELKIREWYGEYSLW